MPKLHKSSVDKERPGKTDKFLWDSDVNGFGVKITPAGAKVAILQYRNQNGRSRRVTIGKLSDSLTLDQARKRAIDLHRDVVNGIDPQETKQQRREAMTVNQILDLYLASAAFESKAEHTKVSDRGRIRWHVRPLIGAKIADSVTVETVRRLQLDVAAGKTAGTHKTGHRGVAKVKGGPGAADKTVLILRAAFAWAVSEKLLKSNPCEGVHVSQSGQREEIMTGPEDYARMFATLQTMEAEHRIRPAAADAIRVIAFTGARRGEVTGMLWRHVDLKAGTVTLPPAAHKTGKKTGKPRVIRLPAVAQEIIARQPGGEPDDYVFRAAKGSGQITIARPWELLRVEAGLPTGLTLHGLRHSIASHLAMAGASNAELMQALGHRQISTTLRYTHWADEQKSLLAEKAAAIAAAGFADANGQQKAEVIALKTHGDR